jgi:cytochrome P450
MTRMHAATLEPVRAPAHVPPARIYDFDFFAPPGAEEDVHLAWARLHVEAPDIFWTPRNGGHWVATRAEDIREIQTNHERFSHRVFTLPYDPQARFTPLPLGVDPPEHTPYRRIIMPAFLPKVVNSVEAMVRELAAGLVRELAPRGECEFIEDFARKLPIAVFMKIVDLPYEDRETLLPWAEVVVRSSDQALRREAHAKMMGYLAKWVEQRRAEPREDLISTVVHAKVGDRLITDEETFSLLTLVLFGGLDTVASMMGFIARFLAQHPEHRRDLVEHPELRKAAVEELIRRHGVSNTARYITEDCEMNGVRFSAGDLIQVPNTLYGLDERVNDDPLTVDFRREDGRHAAFGNGPHTCPGAVLARREIAVFLDEWLARIPEFAVKPGSKPQMASGHVNGVTRLELVWDPATARADP